MATESSQSPPPTCDTSANRSGMACPVCGATLIPLRGQWRCSRCYFMLCVGCEPIVCQEPAARTPR